MFHEALLTPYNPPAFPNQEQPPPPPLDLIDSAEHYKVEKVLDSRSHKVWGKQGEPPRRVMDYFIKWKSYRPESNSWVWKDHMDANELIEEFLTEHVDGVIDRPPNWQSYTDPFTGKKVWYDKDELWEWLGGHNNSSMDTKLPFKLMSIP